MHAVALDAASLVEERPFTHPTHSLADLRILNRSLGRVRAVLHSGLMSGSGPLSTYEWEDEQGAWNRIIVKQGADLRASLTLVGFFGQRRPGVDPAPLAAIDNQLVQEIASVDGLLCYFSSAIEGGNYANLVLCAHDEAKEMWNHSLLHARAVRELAHLHYQSVRLHNGRIDAGLCHSTGPALECTKYYDFDTLGPEGPWRAVRTFDPPLALG